MLFALGMVGGVRMKVGDLVRNKHTVIDTPADEQGIVIEVQRTEWTNNLHNHALGAYFVRVVWFSAVFTGEYESWMDSDDLEVLNEDR